MAERVVLVRHGETEWSRSRRHTGRTDVALTELGRRRAEALAPVLADLAGIDGAQVLTSPLARARDTCALAGLGDRAAVCDDLAEWDYGTAEGRRTEEIREEIPGWSVWTHTVEGGESLAAVGARTESVIARLDARPAWPCCSPTPTCCGSWAPAGAASRHRPVSCSPWSRRACPSSATSVRRG